MRIRGPLAGALVAAVLAATAACTGGGGGNDRAWPVNEPRTGVSQPPPAARTEAKAYDPPKAFAARGVVLPSLTEASLKVSVLHGTTVYTPTAAGIQALDTVTAQVSDTFAPEGPPLATGPTGLVQGPAVTGPPALLEVGGRELIVAPFVVLVPGRGTTAGRTELNLIAIDPADNTAAWTMSIPLPTRPGKVSLIGAHGDRVFVATQDSYGSTGSVHALDTAVRTLAWSKDGFFGATVTGGSVIGVEPQGSSSYMQVVTALSVADGSRRWSLPNNRYETRITYIGPKLVVVEGRDYSNGRPSFQLVDGDTGTDAVPAWIGTSGALGGAYNMRCLYDQRAVTVCSGVGIVMGLDAMTGNQLWRLPDQAAGRVAPSATVAWHGAVYGTASGPVILDATTGQDVATPDIAPVLVSANVGIAADTSGKVRAYPATG
ncbi:PQQ-like beta-propeller repeat protein [Yinghuangia sp. ASG 101]|uniref:outer membrane protein assembly factor BamB family protein n=1 Tax=Yinghuangia sp. ASG 101 TaxID=2896848 RepID=UPI001E2B0AC2|nr:PQQ-binding-like beta-propeller repeat protein [Yinghuangia sp. ASG 101]UGQ15007.1 PQQ-like beta-propeller repeat protein [Yinghuangia sp. ASG 101]